MPPSPGAADAQITTRHLFARIQEMLHEHSSVIAETGDSWFNGMNLELPDGAKFEIQMQYGSIGWSVGATLGTCLAQSAEACDCPDRRWLFPDDRPGGFDDDPL